MWFIMSLSVWILLAGVTFSYWYLRNQFLFWAKRGVSFKKPHWVFGNYGDVVRAKIHITEFLVNNYKEFKSERFCGIWRFCEPSLFVIDPELISHILVKDWEIWAQRGVPFNPDHDPLSATLVNINGKKWKSMRMKLSPSFTPGKLKQMFCSLLECGKDFETYLDTLVATGGLVEATEMCARFVTDVNYAFALGIQGNSFNDESPLFEMLKKEIMEGTLRQKVVAMLQLSFPRLFELLKLRMQSKELTDFFLNVVEENFEYREKNSVQRDDFTDLLRSLKNSEYDDKFLAAQAFDFFAGGFESASMVISYCLYELAVNEGIQDHLRKEVHVTKAKDNGGITYEGLNNMKYLDMVVQETMRKYPTTVIHYRKSVKRYRIPETDVELPSGTTCLIPVYALHHDPDYYPDPEKFDPERFTREAKSQRPAFTFLPFGAGPRNCIGLRLGEHQVKVALVKLLDNFRISLCEESKVPSEFNPDYLVLVPKSGIWLRISKISCN